MRVLAACALLAAAGTARAVVTAADYLAHVKALGVEVEGVTITDYGVVKAAKALKKGDTVFKIPGAAIVHIPAVKEEVDLIVDWQRQLVDAGGEDVAKVFDSRDAHLAIYLLAKAKQAADAGQTAPFVPFEVAQRPLESGLDAPDGLRKCVHHDARAHLEALELQLAAFGDAVDKVGLSSKQAGSNTLLYVMQNAAVSPTGDFMIFPVVDALLREPAGGNVAPGAMTVKPRAAETDPIVVDSAEFRVTADVAKGGELVLPAPVNIFRAIALYGYFTDDVTEVPLDLTWGNLPGPARAVLEKHGCGQDLAFAHIVEGSVLDDLETCIHIAAAFQVTEEAKFPAIRDLDYSKHDALPHDIALAGYDLLDGILKATLDRSADAAACAEYFDKMPVLGAQHRGVTDAVQTALRRVEKKAEARIALVEEIAAAQGEGEDAREADL